MSAIVFMVIGFLGLWLTDVLDVRWRSGTLRRERSLWVLTCPESGRPAIVEFNTSACVIEECSLAGAAADCGLLCLRLLRAESTKEGGCHADSETEGILG